MQGQIEPHSATIEAPIGRRPGKEWKMGVIANGKEAVTHYDLLEMMNNASLLKINLETGRTHQIRVHMQAIGHPCGRSDLWSGCCLAYNRVLFVNGCMLWN